MCGGRNQDLAAHVAALLLRRELVLEMNARGPRLDISARDLVRVERTAEAGFRTVDIVPIEHPFWRFYRLNP